MGVFTVTCLEIDGSAGRNFFLTWTTRMHIVTLIMLPNINYVLLFTWDIFAFYQFVGCFVNIFWKIRENFTVGGFREGRSSYTKHNYFLPYLEY